jgi:hypothetical protein
MKLLNLLKFGYELVETVEVEETVELDETVELVEIWL